MGSTKGISDAIAANIARLETQKAKEKEDCDLAEQTRDMAYGDMRRVYNTYYQSNDIKVEIEHKIKILEDKLRAEIRNAVRRGIPTFEIEQRYGKMINALMSQLTIAQEEYKLAGDKSRVEEQKYRNGVFDKIKADGDFIGTCHELTGEYLSYGNIRQREIVNDAMSQKPLDLLG